MVLYEIKKVLSSCGGKIALIVFACVIVVSCWMATIGVEWMNENGEWETDLDAARKLRVARQEWKGYLDEETLTGVITELNHIVSMPEYTSKDYNERHLIYHYRQSIQPIWEMFIFAYSPAFQTVDETVVDRLITSDAEFFYSNRIRLLTEGIYDENKRISHLLSEQEKQYLISKYEELETPFYYDYVEGWEQMLSNSFAPIMYGSLVLGFLVAGIFANEYKWKSDAVFFSTFLGRNKAIISKIKAGVLLVTLLYWIGILIYTLFTLCFLGFNGGNCPIQISYWKSFYNLTYMEAYLFAVIGGYIGNLFVAFLAMWMSAKTKSAVVAVTVPFIVIMIPRTMQGTSIQWLNELIALLPDQLMRICNVIQYLDTYDLGFTVIGRAPVLFAMYSVFAFALVPVLYREYWRKSWC